MKSRWKIFIALGIFLVAVAVIWALAVHVQLKNEVEAYKKSLRDQGEKLEISENLPPVPAPGQNGAAVAEAAFKLFPQDRTGDTTWPLMMKMISPGKAIIGWSQLDVHAVGADGFTNSWEEFRSIVELNRPATALLAQAADFPAMDFHPNYEKGLDGLLLPSLAPLKLSAQKLAALGWFDLHLGDTGGAVTNICALLALVRDMQNERTEISQLVRMAMTPLASACTWELLQSTNVSDPELATLQKGWTELEFIAAAEKTMGMERAFQEDILKKARSSTAEAKRLFIGDDILSTNDCSEVGRNWLKSVRESGALTLWRFYGSYPDELRGLKMDQAMLDALRAAETNQPIGLAYSNVQNRITALENSASTNSGNGSWLFSEVAAGDAGFPPRVISKEAGKCIVITAIALKRFQLKHGHFPEKLSELTPDFIATVPLDVMDGLPLRYRRNADGTFLLYSIGKNGIDDGGDPSPVPSFTNLPLQWLSSWARDWVWPQPATAAEVQYYYEHPSR